MTNPVTPNSDQPLILNVDDNDGARYAKSRILRLAGFAIVEASNGADALRVVRESSPVLVLLDTKLPDLSGFDVCKSIKADPQTEDVLVLQTSASFLNSADKIRALDGGADNYLVEPIEADELIANVNALLRLRRVKQNLSESEMRFRQIAENIADVFWIFTPHDSHLLYVSPAYEALWQRDSERLKTDPGDWINSVHPDDRLRVEEAFSDFRNSEPFDLTYRLLLAGDSVRWIRDRGYPVKDKSGRLFRIARISQDVSDRKMAEDLLNAANRRKDEFLATLAHELRNPLGPILHSVELLKTDPSIERVAQSGPMIERHTRHLMRLVDDLLDISRVTQGKVTIKRDRVELKSFLSTAVEAVQPFLQSRQHQLQVDVPDEDIWLDGDAVRLAQIVGNVLHNAGKYTAQGGLIRLQAQRIDTSVRISVSDNGIGIEPKNQLDIFELFVQADHSSDRAQDGLGIGLSLVKTLALLHNATIRVVSPGKDRGSTFEIDFPIAPVIADAVGDAVSETAAQTGTKAGTKAGTSAAALAATNKPASTKDPKPDPDVDAPLSLRQARGRILIVDDNSDSAEALSQLLQLDGFEVDTEADGPAALRYVERHNPCVIFLDIGLPGMTGYELAQKLRQLPATRDAVLVALTGYGQEKDKNQAFEAGFDHHLVKPADIAQVRAILASWCR